MLLAASSALADPSLSSNWAGYAVHKTGVQFRSVVGSWRLPAATCPAGANSYSAIWVGLGGYDWNSPALEQIGTEEDCTRAGQVDASAWFELVPAAASTIRMSVSPGDLMRARVRVNGHEVALRLADETTHHTFTRTLSTSAIDISSAEWIVEAPSNCLGEAQCVTLPLADFGSAAFGSANVTSTTGRSGSISNRGWGSTQINLVPRGRRFAAYTGAGLAGGAASASTLGRGGTSFSVTFSPVNATPPVTPPNGGPPETSQLALPARH